MTRLLTLVILALSCISCRQPYRGLPDGMTAIPLPPRGSGPGARSAEAEAEARGKVYVVLGGDFMLQDQINLIAKERGSGDLAAGYAWFLEGLRPLLDDLRGRGEVRFVVNLESPTAASVRHEPVSYPPTFNGPPEALAGLKRAGVDAVAIANNHATDQGRAGLAETIEAAREAGLLVAGAGADEASARAPIELNAEPRVLLLAYYHRPGGAPEPRDGTAIALLDGRAADEVRAARAQADALVVTVHWVGEFASVPRPEWVELARDLAEAGADAVVCHGPHVVGPADIVETSDGRMVPVAYSIGNLVSNMGWEIYPGKPIEPGKDSAQRVEAREEALAVLEFSWEGRQADGSTSQALSAWTIVPMWLMDNRYAAFRPGAGPRLIYPLVIPDCVLPDPFPCFPASKPAECEAMRIMVESGCGHVLVLAGGGG